MAKNTKTPVMILQELTVKKGYDPPEYNLVYSVQGTHENEFHFEVIVHTVSAKGVGRSKKEAKHEAARLALQFLAEEGICHPDESPDSNACKETRVEGSPLKPPLNCIPKLMEICFENKIPTPEFKEISAVGPPHCREFTYECHVASIVTRAIAGSKKHAKQVAAKEMLERIMNVLPDIREQCENYQLQLTEKDMEVMERYSDLTSFNGVKVNFDVEISKYDIQLKKLMEEKCLDMKNVAPLFLLPKTEEILEQLLDLFGLKFKLEIIQDNPPIVALDVNSDTPVCVLESGKNLHEASEHVLCKMFRTVEMLLQ